MDARERIAALESARTGDAQALGALLESFRPYVRVLVRALRDERASARVEDADLVQDALLEATRSFPGFKGGSLAELTVWLRRIAVRTTGRALRAVVGTAKRDPGRERPADDLDALVGDPDSSPSAVAARHEEAARMAEALARLPEEMQQVLLGRHVDDLPHAILAERLGRSEAAVRMLYLRALARLRELYRA
jgi:RNA polymerase sigma-70 factor (ECF subfamily)